MFSNGEIKRNLHGCLDSLLLMASINKRFGSTYDEAIRSFIWPAILFPLTLLFISTGALPQSLNMSTGTFIFLYSMRLAGAWGIYMACVYWLTKQINRKENFCQFVIASNWLTVPAAIVFIPAFLLLFSGQYGWQELAPVIAIISIYTYMFSAFMAHRVLKIPIELAGFITIIGITINSQLSDLLNFVVTIL